MGTDNGNAERVCDLSSGTVPEQGSTTDEHAHSEIKARVVLVLLGTVVGAILSLGIYWFAFPSREGEEFSSVADFRKSLKDPRADGRYRKPDGSLPFAAIIQPHASDEIIYTLKPNINDSFAGAAVSFNSFGMRNRETTLAKKPGVYRLAILGDSFAFGWGVPQEKSFAQRIEDKLNAAAERGINYEILNFGVPGYSTFQEVALFKERGLQFEPNAVLVFLIHNDFDFPFFIRSPQDASMGLVESFSLSRIVGARNRRLEEKYLRGQGLDPNTSLLKLVNLLKPKGIKLFLVVNPRKNWHGIIQQLYVLKKQPEIMLLDIGDEFEKVVEKNHYTDKDLNLPNDPHPTELRHEIYAELIIAKMKSLL